MVKHSFNIEESPKASLLSLEDNKSMEILKATCKKVDGRYEVGLL